MTSGTCIPTFSSQVLKRLYLFYLCDSLHPNVGQSLLQLSPSLHISDTRTRNPANSSILPLCPTIQGWLTGRCPIENFSCFSFFTLDLVTYFLSSCPLEWEWVGIRMSLSLPAFFYHFLRLSKTFCFLVTDWRWRGWDIWWPDECCSQNAAVIKEVELETAKGEVSMDPREEPLRSLREHLAWTLFVWSNKIDSCVLSRAETLLAIMTSSCRTDLKCFGQLALVSACMVKVGSPSSVQDPKDWITAQ